MSTTGHPGTDMVNVQSIPLENMVAFCVLMQNGRGILDKSPDYIREKFETVLMHLPREIDRPDYHPEWSLDHANQAIFHEWFARWQEVPF